MLLPVPPLGIAMELPHHPTPDASFLASCSALFICVYVASFALLARRGWKRAPRLEAASCCMSILHGSLATLTTAYNIHRSLWRLDAPNSRYQELVMEFSTAYFLVDLLHYGLFMPQEVLFILHHIATSTYMLSCRYYTGHGAVSVMALLGMAECTGPLQNIWNLTLLGSTHSALAARIHNVINPFFITYFSIVRGVLGPWLTFHLCRFYFSGQADHVIPRWLAYYWMCTVILAIAGSLFWVSRLWMRLIESRKEKLQAKKL